MFRENWHDANIPTSQQSTKDPFCERVFAISIHTKVLLDLPDRLLPDTSKIRR
jgi:hypothetical protein